MIPRLPLPAKPPRGKDDQCVSSESVRTEGRDRAYAAGATRREIGGKNGGRAEDQRRAQERREVGGRRPHEEVREEA